MIRFLGRSLSLELDNSGGIDAEQTLKASTGFSRVSLLELSTLTRIHIEGRLQSKKGMLIKKYLKL